MARDRNYPEHVNVRLSDDSFKRLDKIARKRGVSVGELARDFIERGLLNAQEK